MTQQHVTKDIVRSTKHLVMKFSYPSITWTLSMKTSLKADFLLNGKLNGSINDILTLRGITKHQWKWCVNCLAASSA